MQSDNTITGDRNLAEQGYWDTSYSNYSFSLTPEEDKVKQWIKKNIPGTQTKSCFEIGCFPARYLSVFGELGYELNGIDVTPRTEKELPEWLKTEHFKVGEITREDIFSYTPGKQFDVVCSFGFIEHFTNWQELIEVHFKLTKPGGIIMIEVPNFRGAVQNLIHKVLDKENLERHYTPSMDPKLWGQLLKSKGCEILYSGYFPEFDYWYDKPPVSSLQKVFASGLKKISPLLRKLPVNKSLYSPYCGVIAKRRQ